VTINKKIKGIKDFTSSIMSSSSNVSVPTFSVSLTEVDQRHIDLMRVRNERFTNKLIAEQTKKEKFQN